MKQLTFFVFDFATEADSINKTENDESQTHQQLGTSFISYRHTPSSGHPGCGGRREQKAINVRQTHQWVVYFIPFIRHAPSPLGWPM